MNSTIRIYRILKKYLSLLLIEVVVDVIAIYTLYTFISYSNILLFESF